MAIVTLEAARAHLRLEDDYPADQIQVYVDGAIDAAAAYLNRAVFEAAEQRDAARGEIPAQLKAAQAAYDDALTAAADLEDETERQATVEVAAQALRDAKQSAAWNLHGIVVTPSVRNAILLTLGHLHANREEVVVGAPASELPRGARDLLRPFRRVMMP